MKKAIIFFAALLFSCSLSAQYQRIIYSPANPAAPAVQTSQSNELIRSTLIQDFESYADFSLSFSPWTTNDLDGSATYGIQDVEFPHAGEPMSYIVFNPASTTPSMSGDAALQPHGGSRFAACFASTTPANNDWIISPQIALGSNGVLKFWVKSYTSQYGLERYKVGVSTTNNNPSSFTIISPGTYLEAPAGSWEQKTFDLSTYNGQNIYVGIQCVSNDAFIFMLDDLEVTSQTVTGGTLTGRVTDAVNGNPIQNALVSIAGLTDLTDANGNYAITGIPAGALNAEFNATPTSGNAPLAVQFTDLSTEGTQTVTCSATGYTTYTNNQVVIPAGGSLELQISLSPTLAAGQYRVVLTWGEQPLDIDSHLKTPMIEGNSYHIYYQNYGAVSAPPYAQLDIDDTESFGPETVTIYQLKPGEYRYYVHNYSQSPAITTSNAVVQVYSENGLMQTFNVPTAGEGLYWDVFKLSGSGAITPINQIVSSEPGLAPFLTPGQMIKKPAMSGKNIVSWSWNFGDGGTSTQQNPNHTYAANGTYTVSLTVSDGTSSNTETKTGYITVTGGSGGTATLTGKVTDALNGNPVPNALVSVAGLTDLTDANGNYSITGIPAGVIKANFTATPTTGPAPTVVQFTDLSTENAHIVTCSATGYTTYTNNQVVIPNGGSLELQISLSPTLSTGQYRFVLTWGALPTDLDSHLKTPLIEGSSHHIYFENYGSASTPPYAILDIDDTDSYGPETTTIYELKPGEYNYYIHNYSQSPAITTSNAVVQIFNDNGLLHTLQVPTTGDGLYWNVCRLNGSGQITIINQIVDTEPGSAPFLAPDKLIKKAKPVKRNIVSWTWNFGDGGTSTEQNPSHKYLNNGSYTVSLTVSDGTSNNTETKNAYIIIGPAGVDEASWEKEVSIFPNPAHDKMNITSEIPVHSISLVDLNGHPVIMLTDSGKSVSIDASNLPNAVYILRISTDKGIMVRKMTIQR